MPGKRKAALRDPDVLCVGEEQVSRFVYVIGVAERVVPVLASCGHPPEEAAHLSVAFAEALWVELQKHFCGPLEAETKQD